MNRDKQDRLDEMLRGWSLAQSPAMGSLQRLKRRIDLKLQDDDQPTPVETARRAPLPRPVALAGACGAGAVAILVMVALRFVEPQPSSALPVPADYASISPDEVLVKQELLGEMQRLFEGRLAWVVEKDSDVQIDLVAGELVPDATFLVSRFAMLRRDASNARWQLAWTIDVLSRDQHLMRIRQAEDSASAFAVWAFILPDGNIVVDVDAKFSAQASSKGSAVLRPGIPGPVLSAQHDGTEYCIYQTVSAVRPGAI